MIHKQSTFARRRRCQLRDGRGTEIYVDLRGNVINISLNFLIRFKTQETIKVAFDHKHVCGPYHKSNSAIRKSLTPTELISINFFLPHPLIQAANWWLELASKTSTQSSRFCCIFVYVHRAFIKQLIWTGNRYYAISKLKLFCWSIIESLSSAWKKAKSTQFPPYLPAVNLSQFSSHQSLDAT